MSKLLQEVFVSLLLVCLSITLYFWLIPNYVPDKAYSEMSPRFFPIFGTLLIGLFALLLLCISILRAKNEKKVHPSLKTEVETKKLNPLLVVMALSIFIVIFDYFGFLIASPISLGLLMLIFGNKNVVKLLLTTSVITGALYAVFKFGLNLSI